MSEGASRDVTHPHFLLFYSPPASGFLRFTTMDASRN